MQLQFFPKRHLVFRTSLTETEVLDRLATHLRQAKAGAIRPPADTYLGEIEGNTFYIHERVGYRGNSFTPGIRGKVERDDRSTIVRVTLHLSGCVRIFVLVWSYVPLLILFLSLWSWVRDGDFNPISLVMILPLAIMYWMMRSGFADGSETARAFMATTFEGAVVE